MYDPTADDLGPYPDDGGAWGEDYDPIDEDLDYLVYLTKNKPIALFEQASVMHAAGVELDEILRRLRILEPGTPTEQMLQAARWLAQENGDVAERG